MIRLFTKGEVTNMRRSTLPMAVMLLSLVAFVGQLALPAAVVALGEKLTHNSTNLGTAYGTWGTTYTCYTCHNSGNANIMLVNQVIDTPIGSRPVVFYQFTASSSSAAVLGNDNRTANQQASQNICEVCHHKTTVHQYSASKVTLDKNHKNANNKDCTLCHPHSAAFKASCDTCHGNPPLDSTIGTSTGLATPATNAASPGAHNAHVNNMNMTCAACHNNSVMPTLDTPKPKLHIQFKVNNTTYPYWTGATTAPFGSFSGQALSASYGGYSTGATKYGLRASGYSCNTYCHANWANNGGTSSNPSWTVASTGQCGSCHFTTAATVPATAPGSHSRHASSNSATPYAFKCTACHSNVTDTTRHVQGFAQVNFDLASSAGRINAGATYKGTDATTTKVNSTGLGGIAANYGTCGNLYCHSSGRALGTNQYNSVTWGGTTLTCRSCHGGKSGATTNDYLASTAGFKLSTTHSQHMKYPAANINCQICHSQTVTNAATLKNLSGVKRHINGKRDVTFTGVTYGSYTSYKSTEVGAAVTTRYCTNVSCHGGKSRSPWSASTVNNTHTCTHCHGQPLAANVPTSNTNLKMYAPGWNNAGNIGTSTDQVTVSSDLRVGAHFVHLSSTYMPRIKCNECHYVPTTPFDVSNNHMNGPRYSSQSLYFAQASSARILIGVASGSTPAQLAAFAGFTSGTATKAATCSSVYCHGNRLKNNITSGTARKPSWTQDLTATPATTTSCGRCHGYPPTDASLHGAGDTTCSTCHSHVATGANPTSFVNKALHINGRVEATGGDCIGCHGANIKGARRATNADFAGKSHHVTSGTLTKWHCILCHAEGDTGTGGTSTVHANGAVDLRNVDTPGNPGTAGTNYWAIPVTKVAADYTNIDNFCFKCHDAVGSAGIAINASNALITTGLTATNQQKPFNDNLTNSYDQIARTRVVDVDTQFTATNYSHHAVKAAKYTAAGGLPFNTAAILHGGNVDDNSRLHCHDCHRLNGHGTANNEYMLQNSSGADTLHTATTYVCFKCHASGTYSSDHTGKGNGSDFSNTAGSTGLAARIANDGNVTGISCSACHNVGGTGWGGIHGGNNTYTQGGGGTQSTYRFMPGMNNNGYTTANWTAATSAISCYTNPNASWGGCTSHTGGKSVTLTRPAGARALSY